MNNKLNNNADADKTTDNSTAEKAELNNRAIELSRNRQFDQALDILKKALEKYPCDSVLSFNYALTLLKNKDIPLAISWLKKALDFEKTPRSKKRLAVECALALSEAEVYEEMEYFLKTAEDEGNESPVFWNLKGISEFTSGNYNSALKYFEKSLALDESFTDAWFNIADTYDQLGLKAEAENAGKKFRELSEHESSPEE